MENFRGFLRLFTEDADKQTIQLLNELDPFRCEDLNRLRAVDAFPCWLNTFVYRGVLTREEYQRLMLIAFPNNPVPHPDFQELR
jgi:hypothetical protein